MNSSKNNSILTSDHPEIPIENAHLKNVIQAINEKLKNQRSNLSTSGSHWSASGAADEFANQALREFSSNQLIKLQTILNEPYFGRFDFSAQGNKTESFYIGKSGFDHEGFSIINWKAPISHLYYKKYNINNNQVKFLSPDGPINGKIWLKRQITIDFAGIQDINDEFDCRVGVEKQSEIDQSDRILVQTLNKRGAPQIQDIIQTIQEEQDELIRKDPNMILVINGAAGSGKTSIVYHRLAYLVYPETNSNINLEKTLVLSPNRFFISYVRSLLPALEINNIQQETFEDWAMKRMGLLQATNNGELHNNYKIIDRSVEVFLNRTSTKQQKIDSWKRSKLKGSLRFKTLLEEYVRYRKNKNNQRITNWIFPNLGDVRISINYSLDEIRAAINKIDEKKLPFNKFIDQFIETLLQHFDNKYEKSVFDLYLSMKRNARSENDIQIADNLKNEMLAIPHKKHAVRTQLEKQVRDKVYWLHEPIVLSDYFKLLADIHQLFEINKGFNKEEIRLLQSFSHVANTYDFEDIPGLFYLSILADGTAGTTYDHIVVDEAQDYSPLQFHILRKFDKIGSMTIAGDIAQGIFAHRGISNWDELESIFAGKKYEYCEVSKSYRSTRQIVQFSNKVKERIMKGKVKLSEPFQRDGEMPVVIQSKTKEQQFKQISEDISHLLNKSIKNIGVIVKTPSDCSEVAWNIENYTHLQVSCLMDINSKFDYQGGVVVLPVNLSKGIEFEAVLVINVDEITYESKTEYDGRLLYVAITRALHYLYLYSCGQVSGFLNTAMAHSRRKIVD